MLNNYYTQLQTYLNTLDKGISAPPKHVVQYLQDQLTVAFALVELGPRPMVHHLKATVHMALLDGFFDGELDEPSQSQVEQLWRDAIYFADQQPKAVAA